MSCVFLFPNITYPPLSPTPSKEKGKKKNASNVLYDTAKPNRFVRLRIYLIKASAEFTVFCEESIGRSGILKALAFLILSS